MVLSQRLVQEYQKEYQCKYGKNISPKDAEKELLELKDLVRLILKERRNRHGR